METYLQISLPVSGTEQSEILVALLSEIGFDGFEQEPRRLQAFIPALSFDHALFESTLAAAGLPGQEYQQTEIAPKNWNAEWEKQYPDVRIGNYCRVRAPFHDPEPGFEFDLLITPKMSFGTGHHATTYMMIDSLQHFPPKGKRVLDFGTGTGVLAILAKRSGATEVRAIDNDPWSIENAAENFAANQCTGVSLALKDSLEGEGRFDLILANVNLRVILSAMPFFGQHLRPGGVVVGSGVLESDQERIQRQATDEGFSMNVLACRDNWMNFSLRKQNIS